MNQVGQRGFTRNKSGSLQLLNTGWSPGSRNRIDTGGLRPPPWPSLLYLRAEEGSPLPRIHHAAVLGL